MFVCLVSCSDNSNDGLDLASLKVKGYAQADKTIEVFDVLLDKFKLSTNSGREFRKEFFNTIDCPECTKRNVKSSLSPNGEKFYVDILSQAGVLFEKSATSDVSVKEFLKLIDKTRDSDVLVKSQKEELIIHIYGIEKTTSDGFAKVIASKMKKYYEESNGGKLGERCNFLTYVKCAFGAWRIALALVQCVEAIEDGDSNTSCDVMIVYNALKAHGSSLLECFNCIFGTGGGGGNWTDPKCPYNSNAIEEDSQTCYWMGGYCDGPVDGPSNGYTCCCVYE